MDDSLKTPAALLEEITELRRRIAELGTIEAKHRKTEGELCEARGMLQLVLDTIPQRVFWKDRQSSYRGCNRLFARDVGVDDPIAIIGKNDAELGWKNGAPPYTDDDRAVMDTDAPKLDFEESQTRPDGSKTWLRTSKVPVHDHNGTVIGILGTYEDITERKRTEEQLRYERGLLRTLIDNLPDAIYAKDNACRKTLANLADVRNMGCHSEAEVLGKNDFDLYPADIASAFFADDRSIIETGQPVLNREEYFVGAEGHKRWLLTSKLPLQDDKGQYIGLVGIGRDITERKRIEEELRESEERFRLIVENAFDGISIFEETDDPLQARLVECNAQYAEMAGRSREELLEIGTTRKFNRTLSEVGREFIYGGVAFRGSFMWMRPDEKENVIEFTGVPIKIRGKACTIGIDRDVTDRVTAQAEREKLIHELQAALADVKTLGGLLPICAWCKKIRDDQGYYHQIETFIASHSGTKFTHGICPDCRGKFDHEVAVGTK